MNQILGKYDNTLLAGDLKSDSQVPENFFQINLQAPLKQKQVRGNHSPFMTKDLIKAIMSKSKIKNKYLNWSSRENFIFYKRTKNKCNSLTKKEGIMTSKHF